FAAEGRLYLDRDEVKRGRIDRLALGTAQLRGLQVDSRGPDSLKLKRGNLNVRLPDGNAIEHLHFAWGQKAGQKFSGTAVLAVQEDFVSVRTAIGQLVEQKHDVLSAKPFRGASVIRAITPSLTFPGTPSFPSGKGKEPEAPISAGWRGVGGEDRGGGRGRDPPEGCCKDKLSPPELDSVEGGLTVAKDAQGFQRWCANCHRSNDRFPPNFLTGDASKVQTKLEHCAERIYVRLAMHDVPAQNRAKTPMPPAAAREGLEAAELHALRDHAASIVKSQRGRLPALDELLLPGYENLRECLPS
ncbi:MAG TPA: hypothetical protein VFH21_07485, partial [Burkholderiales bacterium]|nr:hypothetical protein [Burkholderiales bacterium]